MSQMDDRDKRMRKTRVRQEDVVIQGQEAAQREGGRGKEIEERKGGGVGGER